MTTSAIRQKLYEYIRIADDKKVKAIFTMVEGDFDNYDWTADTKLMAALDKQSAGHKSGKIKGASWEEVKERILSSSKKKKK